MTTKEQRIKKAEKELYYAIINPKADWFSARLIHLIMKADLQNKAKLWLGFPEFVEVVEKYQNEPNYWENLVDKMAPKNE